MDIRIELSAVVDIRIELSAVVDIRVELSAVAKRPICSIQDVIGKPKQSNYEMVSQAIYR